MSAKDINDPSSIFYRWANSEVELLSEEDIKKKQEQINQDEIKRANMCVIEENIEFLIAYENSILFKENVDFEKEMNREISYIKDTIQEQIACLESNKDKEIYKVLEVSNCYKILVRSLLERAKKQINPNLVDVFKDCLFTFAIRMSTLAECNENLELETYLFLAEHNELRAMHMAGVILAERNEKAKAKELLEKASSLGFQPATLSLESGILD